MAPNLAFGSSFIEEKKDDDNDTTADESFLECASAVDRVRMTVDRFGSDSVVLLTSFGVQSGVMLSIVAEACPDVRVLFIDTQGPSSQRDLDYGRKLLDHVGLKNFSVAKADVTREEFQHGMEEVGISPNTRITPEDTERNGGGKNVFQALSQDVFKVTPLKKECEALNVQCLLSGVRRGQTSERDHFKFLQYNEGGPAKGHPILDWSDTQCLAFLSLKGVPPHPELSNIVNAPKNFRRSPSFLRSHRPSDREEGRECGIHVQEEKKSSKDCKDPVPALPNIVVGKVKCKFCIAAKELLGDLGIEYVEAPVSLFPHLIPAGTKTVPVVYLDKQLIGGYGKLCEHLNVEDTLNTK